MTFTVLLVSEQWLLPVSVAACDGSEYTGKESTIAIMLLAYDNLKYRLILVVQGVQWLWGSIVLLTLSCRAAGLQVRAMNTQEVTGDLTRCKELYVMCSTVNSCWTALHHSLFYFWCSAWLSTVMFIEKRRQVSVYLSVISVSISAEETKA